MPDEAAAPATATFQPSTTTDDLNASIDNLNLQAGDDIVGEVDYDAPESGAFPPRLKPGTYNFLFELEDEPFTLQKVEGRDYLTINHKCHITVTSPLDGTSEDVTIRFCRASFYKHPKMPNSMAADLLRSIGVVLPSPVRKSELEQALRQASERAHGRAEFSWRYYNKASGTTVSTAPRKKKGDVQWPKDANGDWEMLATDPKTGEKGYGRENLDRYKLPEAEPQQATTHGANGAAVALADENPFA